MFCLFIVVFMIYIYMLWRIIYDWKKYSAACQPLPVPLPLSSVFEVCSSLWPSVYVPVSLCVLSVYCHSHCTHVSAIMCRLQAAYHAAKPQVLSQQLQQLDLEDDKVSTYIKNKYYSHISAHGYMYYVWNI